MVYKSSYCAPFNASLDPRIVVYEKEASPEYYFKCTVNTSNKKISGYSVKLYDGRNNVVFPYNNEVKISPLSELLQKDSGLENSGLNGTEISFPFFQNRAAIRIASYNAVYYKPKYKINYIIGTSALGMSGNDDIAN